MKWEYDRWMLLIDFHPGKITENNLEMYLNKAINTMRAEKQSFLFNERL